MGDDPGGSYDRVAGEYAARMFDELGHKPLDRALLSCFAEQVAGLGPVADIGCGPGQVARVLHEQGVPVVGIDLSSEMVAQARRLNPGLEFRQGSMLALDAGDGSWGGIVAFYSIIHVAPAGVPRALGEFHRVLRPGGLLLLSFHAGDECRHLDEWWGQPVSLDFQFYERPFMERALEEAGFAIEAAIERQPYPDVEVATRRVYLLARRPA